MGSQGIGRRGEAQCAVQPLARAPYKCAFVVSDPCLAFMLSLLRTEWRRLLATVRTLDGQTVFVLTFAAVAVVLQFTLGSRSRFVELFSGTVPRDWLSLAAWGWWFGMQGIVGFVLPVVALRVGFRQSWADMGVGLGNWRLASLLAGLYVPIVAVGTWVLSDGAEFQAQYPHLQSAARDWQVFLLYEALFLFYWVGWEYLWRGFMIFGTRHTLGVYAIFVQALPFAALHVDKPWPEAVLSIVGGIALGALVWRCRSFWIAVPIHAAQMLLLDAWCTLRIRTGVDGIGLDALRRVFSSLG